MEHLALTVLKNTEAAEEIRARYKYVFVDEYQDTSPIQESIIKALPVDNLFMVGDVKQRTKIRIADVREKRARFAKRFSANAPFRTAAILPF